MGDAARFLQSSPVAQFPKPKLSSVLVVESTESLHNVMEKFTLHKILSAPVFDVSQSKFVGMYVFV